jgi:hypothetical protein
MNTIDTNNHESRTYDEISQEFKELYPTALRVLQLIGLMYNRLTLLDNYSHKDAILKIFEDHKELPGFSKRNIYRGLPNDNPKIPKRVVSIRHKSSETEIQVTESLSTTEKTNEIQSKEAHIKPCPNCQVWKLQKQELMDALAASSAPTTADKFTPQIHRFKVHKERRAQLIDCIEKSNEYVCLEFDRNGRLLSIIPDSYYKNDGSSITNQSSRN